jgi:hypothetical protein
MIQAVPATATGRSIEDLMADLARTRSAQATSPDGSASLTPSFASVSAPPSAPLATGASTEAPFVRQAPSGSGVEIVLPPAAKRTAAKKLVVYAAALGLGAFVLVAATVTGARRVSRTPAPSAAAPTTSMLASPGNTPEDDQTEPAATAPPASSADPLAVPPLELDPPNPSPTPAVGTRTFKKRPRPRSPASSSTTADPKSYR